MRAVEDHHVDRPDVDAQQWVKLTGPNRSIGLIQPTHPAQRQGAQGKQTPNGQDKTQEDRKTDARGRKTRDIDLSDFRLLISDI